MPIIPLICPNCGANLQVNSDDPILTCQYCGGSSVMKDAIVHNYIQNTVNITAGTVNVVNQKDFVIEGGVLKKYQGESVDVVIPNNVVSIGSSVFKDLKIRSVVIPDSVTEIGSSAFEGCTSLTSVTIPGSVKEIGGSAFKGCTSLTSVTIPGSVKEIGSWAFECCTSLTSVTIPDSVTRIDCGAFKNCTLLTSVTIPNSVKEIGDCTFSACTSLKSVTIPDSVTTIYSNAFNDCTSLTSVTIPDSTKIAPLAFWNTPYKINKDRRQWNVCQYCGGQFKGAFKKVCAQCGKPKDY